MKRFVEGSDREQSTLFPECVADWIGEDNPVWRSVADLLLVSRIGVVTVKRLHRMGDGIHSTCRYHA